MRGGGRFRFGHRRRERRSPLCDQSATHPSQEAAKDGAPTVWVSSEGWATLYNRVGVVKRHVDQRRVLVFPFVEGFGVALGVAFAHATKARFQNRAVEAWFHQPSIRSLPFRP